MIVALALMTMLQTATEPQWVSGRIKGRDSGGFVPQLGLFRRDPSRDLFE